MKKTSALATFLLLSSPSAALAYFDEYDAARLVQNFSEIVACQVESPFGFEGNPLQYKALQVIEGMDSIDGFGATYVVHWVGDYGCSGGNGTSLPQFTVVTRSGFSSADPIVSTDYKTPEGLIINIVTDFYTGEEEGVFHVEGVGYGPDDRQGNPTEEKTYSIKVDNYGGMEILSTDSDET